MAAPSSSSGYPFDSPENPALKPNAFAASPPSSPNTPASRCACGTSGSPLSKLTPSSTPPGKSASSTPAWSTRSPQPSSFSRFSIVQKPGIPLLAIPSLRIHSIPHPRSALSSKAEPGLNSLDRPPSYNQGFKALPNFPAGLAVALLRSSVLRRRFRQTPSSFTRSHGSK